MSEIVKPTPEQIATILADHEKWLRGQTDGVRANLYGANLKGANLKGANLKGADLTSADLTSANLTSANLYGANLKGADLYSANLTSANLKGANLKGANLYGANLYGAKNAELALAITEILSREGEVYGWKKCRDGVLVKLRVPPEAKRSNATGRKCRAEFAQVLEVVGAEVGLSKYDGKTAYRVGETVKPDHWNPDRLVECTGGIHFFLTREEAEV